MKVYVCARFTHYDFCFIEHFIKYYTELGVYKFLINFNYKMKNDSSDFNTFLNTVKNNYSDNIIYNVGPNYETQNEVSNIDMLKCLVINNTNIEEDFIIPADSDEFHEFPDNLENILTMMNVEKLAYLNGSTKERVSETGDVILLENEKDIFLQFPKYNNNLFCQPKISLIRAKYFKYTGVGHHYINTNSIQNENDKISLSKYKYFAGATNHFRWNLQGKERIKTWITIWSDNKYYGWKDIEKYKKILNAFNTNLLEYK
jgi:hypothetical protein